MKDVAYFVADNCETNQSISRKLQIPLIGCAAHKLNLAVKLIFGHFESLLEKVKSAISELGTLKNRGFDCDLLNIIPHLFSIFIV